jgi:hypothetical protein
VSDERFKQLDAVARMRFDALDRTKLLVYMIDNVDASALPALAWQFRVLGDSWSIAPTDAEKRSLLRRAIARRRSRGTTWAVKDALDAVGYPVVFIEEGVRILYDASITYSGAFRYDHHWAKCWIIVDSDIAAAADYEAVARAISATFNEWKRAVVQLAAVYFVLGAPSAEFTHDVAAVYWPDTEELRLFELILSGALADGDELVVDGDDYVIAGE